MTPQINSSTRDDLLIVKLEAELSSYILDALKREIVERAKEGEIRNVLINLENVEYIASKDLGVFVQIFRFLIEQVDHDSMVAFCCISKLVKNIFVMTKLDTIFKLYETEEEAIAALSISSSGGK